MTAFRYILTGGAGFIGANVLRALNARGVDDLLVIDHLTNTGKWRNLAGARFAHYADRAEALALLRTLGNNSVEAVIHLGACSATTEQDEGFLLANNTVFSKQLLELSRERGWRFLYASSGATYGDGSKGFHDTEQNLTPLNCYGYSKHLFDQWVRRQQWPQQVAGMKFFNVYGPYEYHKGPMASMVFHGYHQILRSGMLRLFRSYRPEVPDGDQQRDFVFVSDAVSVLLFLLDHPEVNGIVNVGSGAARTFNDLAHALFSALGRPPAIEYIEMPDTLRGKYQYQTEADLATLRAIGYTAPVTKLADGVQQEVAHLREWEKQWGIA